MPLSWVASLLLWVTVDLDSTKMVFVVNTKKVLFLNLDARGGVWR